MNKNMKMDKVITILFIIFFLGGIILIQVGSKKSEVKRKSLALYGGIAIGEFDGRSSSVSSKGRTSSVMYSYIVDSKNYKGGDTRCMEDSPKAAIAFTDPRKAKPRDKFLVLYNKNDPAKAIIRLDYPINDSTDYKRYVKEFEQERKLIIE